MSTIFLTIGNWSLFYRALGKFLGTTPGTPIRKYSRRAQVRPDGRGAPTGLLLPPGLLAKLPDTSRGVGKLPGNFKGQHDIDDLRA